MTEPTAQEGRKKAHFAAWMWRWFRRLTVACVLTLLIVGGLVIVLRLFVVTDERLRHLVEEQGTSTLGAPVTLRTLHLDLGSELTLEGLVIGPPPGFTRNVLVVDHVHLAWRLSPLLDKVVDLPEVSARGITAVMEENERGTNVDSLLASLQGPAPTEPQAPPEPPPSEPPPAKEPLTQPRLPMHVIVSRFAFTEVSAEMVSPKLEAAIDRVGLEGSFEGEGDAMNLTLWTGVGDHEGPGRSQARYAGGGVNLSGTQHGGLTVRSSGFGDVDMTLDLGTVTALSEPKKLPEITSTLKAHLRLDLLGQVATMSDTSFRFGKGTSAELALAVHEMLSAPTVSIETLNGATDLGELSPFIEAFAPGVRVSGHIELSAAPMQMALGENPNELSSNLSAKAINVTASAKGNVMTDLDADASVSLASGIVGLSASAKLASATAPQGSAGGLTASLELTTPLAPWMGGESGDAMFAMVSDSHVGHAEAPAASAEKIDLHLEVTGPVAMLRGEPAHASMQTSAALSLGAAAASGSIARDIALTADVSQRDLQATSVDVAIQASVGSATTPLPQGEMTVPQLTASMTASRRGQSVAVPSLALQLGNIMRMTASTAVDAALTPTPRVKTFTWDVEPVSIGELIGLLPTAARPPATIKGSMRAHASCQGTVPYVELTQLAQAPAIPRVGDVWGATLAAYAGFADSWAKRLEKGLGFTSSMTFEVSDLVYSDAASACDGGHMLATADLGAQGPSMRVQLEMANVTLPSTVRDMRWEWTAGIHGDRVETKIEGLIGYSGESGSALALENVAVEGSAGYQLGGDAVINRFAVSLPTLGTRFEARAAMKTPLDVAIAKSWEQSGLPGLAVDASYELRVANQTALGLSPDLAVAGTMSSRGNFALADGAAVFTGDLRAKDMSAKAAGNEVTGLTGSLPFDIRLAFDGRPGTTPLARGLSFGDVGLITGEDATAQTGRPAYYDRLRDYYEQRGITIKRLRSGPYVVENMIIDASMANGRLRADSLAMHVLGGDIVGNMDFRLGNDRSLTGDMDMKVSNIDASYFAMLNLEPGPESEMNADMHMSFVFAPRRRDLAFNMNVTKIGSKTLDRFLQLLDPEEKNDSLQRTRGQLKFVRIDNVAMWVRFENLNMDIDVTTFLRIPFTNIGFPNIERELLRRYSISEQLDFYLQPTIDKTVAPLLGWYAK